MINGFKENKGLAWESYCKAGLVLLILALICSIGILSLVPPISRDALTHHLIVPKLYLQHGGIYEIPSIVFSYYPMNLDLLYMIPLYFGNDIVPKFIHFTFALLAAWLIFSYLRKRLDAIWGLFGSLFFLSLPIIVKLSITAYVDLGLIFFTTASILSLFRWVDTRFQLKHLILAAICCGLALGTKYNGLLVLFILTMFIPFVFINNSNKALNSKKPEYKGEAVKIQFKAFEYATIFFVIALLVFSPWMIRNYVWKSNPIYPLYDNVLNRKISESPDSQIDGQAFELTSDRQRTSEVKSTRWSPFAIRKVIYGESWWEIALIPVRIFFQGQDDNPKYFDGRLNPFLFFLPFFAFIQLKGNPAALRIEKKILVFFAIIYLLYAFSQYSIRIRYIAPVIPPLVILATIGLHRLAGLVTNRMADKSGRLAAGCTLLIATVLLSYNVVYIQKQFSYVDPFSYITGRMPRNAYIAKFRPEYTVYQYANEHLPDRVKILGLFLGNRRYYSDREIIFGVDELKKLVNSAASEEIILNDLRERGYTHLIIRYDLFNQWANTQFDDGKKQILKKFFDDQVVNIFSQDGYGLLELKNI